MYSNSHFFVPSATTVAYHMNSIFTTRDTLFILFFSRFLKIYCQWKDLRSRNLLQSPIKYIHFY